MAEVRERFAFNARRRYLLDHFTAIRNAIARKTGSMRPYYLGGSFVTDVPSPNDLDCVLDLSDATKTQEEAHLVIWGAMHDHYKATCGIDLWCYANECLSDRRLLFQGLGWSIDQPKPRATGRILGVLNILAQNH